jgi:hypothetical protein
MCKEQTDAVGYCSNSIPYFDFLVDHILNLEVTVGTRQEPYWPPIRTPMLPLLSIFWQGSGLASLC